MALTALVAAGGVVALALVLLVGASLFLRTLYNLRHVDVGFNAENLLLFRVNPQLNRYDEKRMTALYGEMVDRIAAAHWELESLNRGLEQRVAAVDPALGELGTDLECPVVAGDRLLQLAAPDPGAAEVVPELRQAGALLQPLLEAGDRRVDRVGLQQRLAQVASRVDVARAQDQPERAARLFGVAAALRETIVLAVGPEGGIAPEELGRVFGPFFSKKRAGESSGTGLGLTIVQGVVKEHQGFIDVTSTPHVGTTFSVYLPQAVHFSILDLMPLGGRRPLRRAARCTSLQTEPPS